MTESADRSTRSVRPSLIAVAVIVLVIGVIGAIALANRATESGGEAARGADAVSSFLLPLPEAPQQRWAIRSGEESFGGVVAAGDVLAAVQYLFPVNEVVGLDRADGSVRWRTPLDAQEGRAIVRVELVDGVVLASVDQEAGTTWFGLDPATGEVLWQTFDEDKGEEGYRSHRSMFFRSSEAGLEKISGATGEVVRTIPALPPEGKGGATDARIQQIVGTVVALYDGMDFSEVFGPTDLGIEVDEVVDAGDVIMGFVEADNRLIAFDLDGRQLATLDMQPPDRGDEQSSALHPVIAERPTMLRLSADRQEVVEYADGELRVTATFEYAGFGTVEHVDGRTLYSVENRSDVGLVDVVDLTAGRVLTTVEGGALTFTNGLVVFGGNQSAITAVDFDGAPLWPIDLTQAIRSDPMSPIFLDGAVLLRSEDANGPLYSLWE